jgi:XTP/dITP diphosphohydrolase
VRVALASRNPGKLRELRALLPGWEIEPLDTAGIGEESGETFYENARAKALFAREAVPAGVWALGEDSGLEVDGLGGAPGIRSARFAGIGASDEQNLLKLLDELKGRGGEGRRARYVCELVLVSPDGRELRGRGTLEGSIAHEVRGSGGFGYDPIFVPDGEERTVGELGDAWKREHSHRARAARGLRAAAGASASRGDADPSIASRRSGPAARRRPRWRARRRTRARRADHGAPTQALRRGRQATAPRSRRAPARGQGPFRAP